MTVGKRIEIPEATNAQVVALLRRAHEPGRERDEVLEFAIRENLRPLAPWCGWPWYNEVGHRESPNVIVTQDCKMRRMSPPTGCMSTCMCSVSTTLQRTIR